MQEVSFNKLLTQTPGENPAYHLNLYNSRVHVVVLGGPSNPEFPKASAFLSEFLWSAYIAA